MESLIKMDISSTGTPFIRVKSSNGDDVRDKLFQMFFNHDGKDQILLAHYGACGGSDSGPSYQEIEINPVDPLYRLSTNSVCDNSIAFIQWLDANKINYKPNGHFTSIDHTVDIFALGMKFQKYKTEQGK